MSACQPVTCGDPFGASILVPFPLREPEPERRVECLAHTVATHPERPSLECSREALADYDAAEPKRGRAWAKLRALQDDRAAQSDRRTLEREARQSVHRGARVGGTAAAYLRAMGETLHGVAWSCGCEQPGPAGRAHRTDRTLACTRHARALYGRCWACGATGDGHASDCAAE